MDEGRKRVIGIMAAILASLHMRTADDLFGRPQGSPYTDKLIAASVQWAERIMQKIDNVFRTPRVEASKMPLSPETLKHLDQVEVAIQQTKPLLANYPYPSTLRTILTAGLADQCIEHHESMLLLLRNDKNGSAFALARSIFESMFRGLWFTLCATDADLEYFEQTDKLPKGIDMPTMAAAIDTATGADPNDPNDQFFKDLKDRGWKTLCSYTHSGLLQLGRRFVGQNLQPGGGYTDEEIVEITTTSTTCVLLLVGTFLKSQGRDPESDKASGLINTYGKVAQQNT